MSALPMRLHQLRVSNFMRITGYTIEARGRHIIVSAKNGTGKTSLLDAIFVALTGADSKAIPEPITHGQAKADIVVDLGEYVVKRVFTAKSTKVVVTAKDGSTVKSPQQFLDQLLAKMSMNPATFLDMRPQDQLDAVLEVSGVKTPLVEVAKITGEDHDLLDGETTYKYFERLSADETGLYYVRRRDAHRELEKTEGAILKQRDHVNTLPVPAEDKSVSDLVTEQQKLEEQQKKFTGSKTRLDDLTKIVNDTRTQYTTANEKLATITNDIAKLKEDLAKKEAEQKSAQFKVNTLKDEGMEAAKEVEVHTATHITLTDHTQAIADLRARIKTASTSQEDRIKLDQAKARVDELLAEREAWDRKHKGLDIVLTSLRALRKKVLEGVDIGVPGLSVGEGTLMFNDVDFKQASMAQGLRVACAVIMRQRPMLPLLRMDNAEHLDEDSKNLVFEMADQHGWQVLMACVDNSANIQLEFVEPEVDGE